MYICLRCGYPAKHPMCKHCKEHTTVKDSIAARISTRAKSKLNSIELAARVKQRQDALRELSPEDLIALVEKQENERQIQYTESADYQSKKSI